MVESPPNPATPTLQLSKDDARHKPCDSNRIMWVSVPQSNGIECRTKSHRAKTETGQSKQNNPRYSGNRHTRADKQDAPKHTRN